MNIDRRVLKGFVVICLTIHGGYAQLAFARPAPELIERVAEATVTALPVSRVTVTPVQATPVQVTPVLPTAPPTIDVLPSGAPTIGPSATEPPSVCLSDAAFEQRLRALLAEDSLSSEPQSEECAGAGGIEEQEWSVVDEDGNVLHRGSFSEEKNVPSSFEDLSDQQVSTQCTVPESVPVKSVESEHVTAQSEFGSPVYSEDQHLQGNSPSDPPYLASEFGAGKESQQSSEPQAFGVLQEPANRTSPSGSQPDEPKTPLLPPRPSPAPSKSPEEPKTPLLPPRPSPDSSKSPDEPRTPLLPPRPVPSVPDEEPEVRCCSYGYSPDDGRSPGGDNFCAPHAEQFDWTAANCDHIINCRLRFDPAAPSGWSFRDCFDRQSRKKMGTLKEVYEKLKCTTIRHVTLHHSNPQWGPKDCQAHVACLPTGPGRDIDVIHNQLGCSTFGSPALRCARAQRLVELFKLKCDTHGRVRLVVTGKQTDLWIPAGRNLDCSWKNPTGHCYFTNAPKMRKLVITPDGFVSCRLVGGKWVEYPEYCQGTGRRYPGNKTNDPDNPKDLRC